MAFGLITILLSVVFSCFTNAAKLTAKTDAAKAFVAKRDLFYQRMLSILTHADRSSINLLDSEEPSLIFTFINGVDRDFSFSGELQASLEVDPHKQLVLTAWSQNKELPPRREILLTHVHKADFEIDKQNVVFTVTYDDKRVETYPFCLPKKDLQELQLKSRHAKPTGVKP